MMLALLMMACAPPASTTSVTPATSAAARISGVGFGVTSTMRSTPATVAGIAVINTVDG